MEDTNKSERCGKLPGVHKFLPMLYTKLQPHCQAIKWTKGQERVEMGRGILKSVWRTQGENHKSTSIDITQERRKIQGRNRCFRTLEEYFSKSKKGSGNP